MDEVKLKSELLALNVTTQLMVAMLSNEGLVDLNDMHQRLTGAIVSSLQKPELQSLLAKQLETATVDSLDQLFSSASRMADNLRDETL